MSSGASSLPPLSSSRSLCTLRARWASLQEMLSRSSLETQKLELLSSVTELKRQLVALSRENAELRALQQHRPPVAPRTFYPSQSQVTLRFRPALRTA